MSEEKNKAVNESGRGANDNSIKGAGSPSFDELVNMFGIDRAIARGVRTIAKVSSDGRISETDFVRAVKKFTGQVPK